VERCCSTVVYTKPSKSTHVYYYWTVQGNWNVYKLNYGRLPLNEFKAAWLSAPVAFPDNAPQPGQDYTVLDQVAPVRDGTKCRHQDL
jgi:hypothetical protein